MQNPNNSIITDIVIVGGGIAGLMLQNKLHALGFSTILLEHDKLGTGQTTLSQGIIHGGIKYAILGQITDAANAVSKMPITWQNYFNNTDSLDLSDTKILSKHHDLWNNGVLKNRLKQVLMQKSLSSTGEALHKTEYPDLFKSKEFKGNLYRINETVVDIHSLLKNLSAPLQNRIIKADKNSIKTVLDNKKNINNLTFTQNNDIYNISAQQYIFTAGQNNQQVLDTMPNMPKMQLRPLHMVAAKFKNPNILYGHYVGNGLLPQLTITTHYPDDGEYIWYIGGKIAETGIYLNKEQQIIQAKVEIKNIFPWLDISKWQWSTIMVNRAEPLQANNIRPDNAYIANSKNAIVGWPTKLTLAPMLVNKIVSYLQENKISPKYKDDQISQYKLETAKIAKPFWDNIFAEKSEEHIEQHNIITETA